MGKYTTGELCMKLLLLHEDTIGSTFRRFIQYLKKDPEFGPGVDPKNWGEVEELIEANGLPRIDFEKEWDKAVELEDNDSKQALTIYKKLADKHPLSGLRSKSYFKRQNGSLKLFVVCDIDNLKFLNSKLGHKGADSVLRKFGELLERYLENEINTEHGNIAKAFHRSGDEFNVIINLQGIDNPKPIIQMVVSQSQKLLNRFSTIEFRSREGRARASATIGISFDEESIDIDVDKTKIGRRKLSIFGKMPHLIIGNDVKPYLT